MRDFRQAFRMMREVYKVANILVCDDDKDIVEAISIYLEQEGYVVFKAYDGLEAINILRSQPVDLLIIDIMMPKLDGIRATLKIREENPLPIIILSAKSEDADKILGLNVGADDYVTKPFSPAVLVKRIEALIRRSAAAGERPGAEQGLVIDRDAYVAYLDGTALELTLKEFEILLYLTDNKSRVLTRDQILNAVWGYDFEGDSRTVDSHMARLRTKLGSYGNTHLKTVYGMGYKFEW